MELTLYQVDAFASSVFAGNPAAVVPLEDWLPDEILQGIALENNLSETAYLVKQGEAYGLRWFTPAHEVDLCGHATLASAFAVTTWLEPNRQSVAFDTRSGRLTVSREGELFRMDFPRLKSEAIDRLDEAEAALGARPRALFAGMDWMAVFERQSDVAALKPDMSRLLALDTRGVIATAPGDEVDFVSRFFAPAAGIPEDPVTGSAHCLLAPYWAERLGRARLEARQISARGGELILELLGERVAIMGRAVPYLEGRIFV